MVESNLHLATNEESNSDDYNIGESKQGSIGILGYIFYSLFSKV